MKVTIISITFEVLTPQAPLRLNLPTYNLDGSLKWVKRGPSYVNVRRFVIAHWIPDPFPETVRNRYSNLSSDRYLRVAAGHGGSDFSAISHNRVPGTRHSLSLLTFRVSNGRYKSCPRILRILHLHLVSVLIMIDNSFRAKIAQYLIQLALEKAESLNPTITTPHSNEWQSDGTFTWKDLIELHGLPTYRRRASTDLPIAIIGAGVAGLRVAMMLDYLEIPYEIFEASKRHGGRCYTYHFTTEEESGLKHDYYDVGAMRFPDNGAMVRTFELFKELDITPAGGRGGKLIRYIMSAPGNILMFNGKGGKSGLGKSVC